MAGARAMLVESTIADCASPESYGGGISAKDHANVTLQGRTRVERCLAAWGGALNVEGGSRAALLEGSVLSECHATSLTGGLQVLFGGHASMLQSSILNCSAISGAHAGGFYCGVGSTLLATSSVRVSRLERACNVDARSGALPHTHQGIVSSCHHAADCRRLHGDTRMVWRGVDVGSWEFDQAR